MAAPATSDLAIALPEVDECAVTVDAPPARENYDSLRGSRAWEGA